MPLITTCLLAGGRGERLGGEDKGLIRCGDRSLAAHCIDRLAPQTDAIVISANRNQAAYRRLAATVVADNYGDYAGPLAGLLSVMQHTEHEFILLCACDCPFVPTDLAARLLRALTAADADIAVASAGGRIQPTFALVRRALEPALRAFLDDGGRRIMGWFEGQAHVVVEFDDTDAFTNINTPSDLENARVRLPNHA